MERFWSRHSVISFIWWLEHYFEKIKYFFISLDLSKTIVSKYFIFFQSNIILSISQSIFFSFLQLNSACHSHQIISVAVTVCSHCSLIPSVHCHHQLFSSSTEKSDTLSVVTIKWTLVVQSVSGERTSSRITSREYLLESETAIV